MKTPIEILEEMIKITESEEFKNDFINAKIIGLKEAKKRIEKECGWISVEDRLPDEGKIILINEGGIVIQGYRDESGMKKLPNDYKSYATHWLPLPLPPNP